MAMDAAGREGEVIFELKGGIELVPGTVELVDGMSGHSTPPIVLLFVADTVQSVSSTS